jgi:hypothetical protein
MSRVDLHVEGPLARVHLNNPAKLNAFTPEMLRQLEAHCDSDRGGRVDPRCPRHGGGGARLLRRGRHHRLGR